MNTIGIAVIDEDKENIMKLSELVTKINATVLTNNMEAEREVTGVYCCDLLSWVMSHACKGDAWITVLTNINIVAVALLTEAACIIVPEGIVMEEAAIKRAEKEGVIILSTELGTYGICSRIPGL